MVRIIGIDCATQPRAVGLALGFWDGEVSRVDRVEIGGSGLAGRVAELIGADGRCLIAIDAPLGWPTALGRGLAGHVAGAPLPATSAELFRRATDRFIKARVGKQPLDVGADRIARTAHAALTLIDAVRKATREAIPLAWGPAMRERVEVIEVYPAATLRARGVRDGGYKRPEQDAERREILTALSGEMRLCDDRLMQANADALDATLCVLAARDFLTGEAMQPEDEEAARREGWIWCADPSGRRRGGQLA